MPESEEEIEQLESQFPAMSGVAFASARAHALASGLSVLQAENGCVVEVFPDGRREVLKKIAPPVKVQRGRTLRLASGDLSYAAGIVK